MQLDSNQSQLDHTSVDWTPLPYMDKSFETSDSNINMTDVMSKLSVFIKHCLQTISSILSYLLLLKYVGK